MKRVLLLGMILAICILAMPQGVLASSQGSNVTVNANIQNVLEFAALGPSNQLVLIRGQDNVFPNAVNFTVNSSANWTITVAEAPTPVQPSPTHVGFMKEWTGSNYLAGGAFLSNSIKIKRELTDMQPLTNTADRIQFNVAGNYARTLASMQKDISQSVTLTDSELFGGNRYQVVFGFSCSQPF